MSSEMGFGRKLSEYELERLENIRRNEAYMRALGLGSDRVERKRKGRSYPKKRAPREVVQQRKSPRLSKEVENKQVEVVEEKETVTPAESLKVYVREIERNENDVVDSQLKVCYALENSKYGLAAAGKAGRVSIFFPEKGMIQGFKNSSAWIGGLAWLENRLATAGNDGYLRIIKVSDQEVQNVTHVKTDAGIWSLTKFNHLLACSDKRGSICVFETERSLDIQAQLLHCSHAGGIKRCCFLQEHLLAAAADDGRISLFDLRLPRDRSAPTKPIWSVHHSTTYKAHSVEVLSSHNLISAGQDDAIRLWDIRQTSQLGEFRGHHAEAPGPYNALRHPIRVSSTSFLAAGQHSAAIALYDIKAPPAPIRLYADLPADATALITSHHSADTTKDEPTSFYAALALSDAALIRHFEL